MWCKTGATPVKPFHLKVNVVYANFDNNNIKKYAYD
jgi:hypothetical protein